MAPQYGLCLAFLPLFMVKRVFSPMSLATGFFAFPPVSTVKKH